MLDCLRFVAAFLLGGVLLAVYCSKIFSGVQLNPHAPMLSSPLVSLLCVPIAFWSILVRANVIVKLLPFIALHDVSLFTVSSVSPEEIASVCCIVYNGSLLACCPCLDHMKLM